MPFLIFIEPLLFAQGGRLENKISQIRYQSKQGTMKKYVGSCLLFFVYFLKFIDQSLLSSNGCISYVSRIWLQVKETTLTFCTR